MTAASGPRIPAPGRGRLRGVEKEGENLPRKPASLPLGLGSLEHEFGGLHIGVFGHGRGKAREPEQERAREAQSGDWARALGKRTRQRSGRVYPLSLAFFHPNVNSQIEFHFLFTAWVRHPQRAEIDPSFFFWLRRENGRFRMRKPGRRALWWTRRVSQPSWVSGVALQSPSARSWEEAIIRLGMR